tara:strand:+ start:181 stop:1518 length:1338 start_codon:yes stop_codon:yes gene_type:complete
MIAAIENNSTTRKRPADPDLNDPIDMDVEDPNMDTTTTEEKPDVAPLNPAEEQGLEDHAPKAHEAFKKAKKAAAELPEPEEVVRETCLYKLLTEEKDTKIDDLPESTKAAIQQFMRLRTANIGTRRANVRKARKRMLNTATRTARGALKRALDKRKERQAIKQAREAANAEKRRMAELAQEALDFLERVIGIIMGEEVTPDKEATLRKLLQDAFSNIQQVYEFYSSKKNNPNEVSYFESGSGATTIKRPLFTPSDKIAQALERILDRMHRLLSGEHRIDFVKASEDGDTGELVEYTIQTDLSASGNVITGNIFELVQKWGEHWVLPNTVARESASAAAKAAAAEKRRLKKAEAKAKEAQKPPELLDSATEPKETPATEQEPLILTINTATLPSQSAPSTADADAFLDTVLQEGLPEPPSPMQTSSAAEDNLLDAILPEAPTPMQQ